VVFGRDSDPYLQRQVITERLAGASALLPAGVGAPLLSPLSSSMEYLLHFGFTSDRLSPLELRDLVRWTLKPQILGVPGVAQAQIFGGDTRERQLLVDPLQLAARGVGLEDVFEAARRGTQMTGGGYLESATQRIVLQTQPPGTARPASTTWTPQAMHGSKEWMVRRISIGLFGSAISVPISAASYGPGLAMPSRGPNMKPPAL